MASRHIANLQAVIACDARDAFSSIAKQSNAESLYGFAIYSDDSLLGLDAAANSIEYYSRKCQSLRTHRFEAYWYPTEWGLEGGVASCFERSNTIIESLSSNLDTMLFKDSVLQALLNAMRELVAEQFFQQLTTAEETLFEISLSDSDDDEREMERSIQLLNPSSTWNRYLIEKVAAGY